MLKGKSFADLSNVIQIVNYPGGQKLSERNLSKGGVLPTPGKISGR
jgi:hypothetical protein